MIEDGTCGSKAIAQEIYHMHERTLHPMQICQRFACKHHSPGSDAYELPRTMNTRNVVDKAVSKIEGYLKRSKIEEFLIAYCGKHYFDYQDILLPLSEGTAKWLGRSFYSPPMETLSQIHNYFKYNLEYWRLEALTARDGVSQTLTPEYLAQDQEIQEDREQEEMKIQFRPSCYRRGVYDYRLPDEFYAETPSENNASESVAFTLQLLFSVIMTFGMDAVQHNFASIALIWLCVERAQKHCLVLVDITRDRLGLVRSRQKANAMKMSGSIRRLVLLTGGEG